MSFKYALKWSFFSEFVTKAIQPLVYIVLARILTPIDFGVMTAALMVIAFSQIFWEAGIGKAIVQVPLINDSVTNTAFWINLILAFLISTILIIFSNKIAVSFFQDVRVEYVLYIMTIQLLLGALSSVHAALLQKQMLFKKVFQIRAVSVIIPSLASIPLALYGWGYWALVAGTLISQFLQTILLWNFSSWKPKIEFSLNIAKNLLSFGGWIAVTGILTWSWTWLDNMLVGYYFGIKEVGLFRMGNQIPLLIFGFLFSFATPVLYSRFSSISNNLEKVKLDLYRVLLIVPAVSFPVAVLIYFNSTFVEKFILGSSWIGVGFIISSIAIKEALLWLFAYNIEAYRSIGRPHIETFIAGGSLLINLCVLIIAAKFDFETFVFSRAYVVGLLSVILHFSVMIYTFGGWNKSYLYVVFKILLLLLVVALCPILVTNSVYLNILFSVLISGTMFIVFVLSSKELTLFFNKYLRKLYEFFNISSNSY